VGPRAGLARRENLIIAIARNETPFCTGQLIEINAFLKAVSNSSVK
jgi:hypothetical protein